MVTRIKICGLTRPEQVATAVRAGASAIGVVLEPSSPRYVGDPLQLAELVAAVPPFVSRVAVYAHPAASIPDWADVVQGLWGDGWTAPHSLRLAAYRLGKDEPLPAKWPDADGILIDAKAEEAMGGTGKEVDEPTAESWIRSCSLPVVLAGGLNPENVGRKIERLGPFGVDVSSGVESSHGVKDSDLIQHFCDAVRAADESRRKKTRGC
jgi:phosphoribosylanthranilate isomerase